MLTWFHANLGNIVVLLILALVIFFSVRSLIRDRRSGRSCCGGNCGACAMGGACHPDACSQGNCHKKRK